MSALRLGSRLAAVMAGIAVSATASASELSYRPMNPSFGGNPMNGSYLFNQAVAQDKSKDKNQESGGTAAPSFQQTPAEQFKSQLSSRLMSALADKITQSIYGTTPQQSGHYSIDGVDVSFTTVNGEVQITIGQGSGSTVITLPAAQ